MNKRKISANAKFCFRSDTLENWEAENPVLEKGEFAVVLTDNEYEKVKIGDGVKKFKKLSWWKSRDFKIGNTLSDKIEPIDSIPNSRISALDGSFVDDEDETKGCVVYILPVTQGDSVKIEGVYNNGVRAAYAYTNYTDSKNFIPHHEIPTNFNAEPQTLEVEVDGFSYIGVETMTKVEGFNFKATLLNRYEVPEEYFLNNIAKKLAYNEDVGNRYEVPVFKFQVDNTDESNIKYYYVNSNGEREEFTKGYIDPDNAEEIPNASYLTSPLLPVTEQSTVFLDWIYTPGMSIVHFYDKDKKYLKAIKYNEGGAQLRNIEIKVPLTVKYMRFATIPMMLDRDLLIVRYNDYVPENQAIDKFIRNWYETADYKIENIFSQAAKPMITFIDDDTINLEHINSYYDLCEYAGIKGCLSVLTANLDGNEALVNRLLELEREGYQAIIHCNTQGAEFGEFTNKNAEERSLETIASCEANLVTGLQKMHKYGFTNYKYWCTPFGYMDKTLRSLAKKWGLNCLISSGNLDYNKPTSEYAERYKIRRMTLNNPASDTAGSDGKTSLQRIKDAITSASEDGGWVLVTTHTYESGWAGEAGKARFKELVDHAKTEGVAIKTVGEAFSIREPIYRFYDTF